MVEIDSVQIRFKKSITKTSKTAAVKCVKIVELL